MDEMITVPRKAWLYRYFGLLVVPVALLAGAAAFPGVLLALRGESSPAYGLGILAFGPVTVLGSGGAVGLAFAVTIIQAAKRGTRPWLGLTAALVAAGATELLMFLVSIVLIRGLDSGFWQTDLWA